MPTSHTEESRRKMSLEKKHRVVMKESTPFLVDDLVSQSSKTVIMISKKALVDPNPREQYYVFNTITDSITFIKELYGITVVESDYKGFWEPICCFTNRKDEIVIFHCTT